MLTKYKTISNSTEFLFKEKASKFFGFAFPVKTEAEVQLKLDELKKKYYDSRHVCYAYVLGADKKLWRINDAGEPNNTAGKPILGQITAFDLTNVLVVVVRYFGGTKLGVGGLIQAYKQTAFETLNLAHLIDVEIQAIYQSTVAYDQLNYILKQAKIYGVTVLNHIQHDLNQITLSVPLKNETTFIAQIERNCLTLTKNE